MKTLKFARSFEVVHELPKALEPLRELAYNFRWTWHLPTQDVFRETDPELWESTERNPVLLLNSLSELRQKRLLDDGVYLAKLNACLQDLRDYMGAETWFHTRFPDQAASTKIAYFCAEFGLHECLPIYSGGLGVLAGDHLKSASDLGIPLVGVGLLYSRGYFRQFLTPDGWQQERYLEHDFYRMPLRLMRGDDDQPLMVSVELPDRRVTCQIWKAQVGRIELFLLDSNILENEVKDQTITDTLYGGGEEMRIRQEMILGIGGFRALTLLGKTPTVCHMNEGHAAFLSLERLRHLMQETGCDYKTARQCVVAGNVFTTHTPVPAGFDVFQRGLLESHISKSVEALGLNFEQFLRLGRMHPDNEAENFNMAVLAMENSNYINGVSKLHGAVSRSMFHDRWPQLPLDEVPIDGLTNGIHTATWIGRRMSELLDRHFGSAWRDDAASPQLWDEAAKISDEELWNLRENNRGDFIRFCRKHVTRKNRLFKIPASPGARDILDPRILTIGFARRFATYKRATLLLRDPERLKRLLLHEERPVQFVFAGKAHPKDEQGKQLIQEIQNFIRREGLHHRMLFLEDYDMGIARELVQGVDVWLNNPRRPMEASGTSGMKVVPNGGLNCSILDGWWAEGCLPDTGWAIGDESSNPDDGYQDWLDSQALYTVLEQEVTPKFYQRGENGVPTGWVDMMRASMKELAPRFSTLRMVREYCARFYVPASNAFANLTADGQVRAKEALAWRERVLAGWPGVKVESVQDSSKGVTVVGGVHHLRASIALGTLSPGDVRVQLLSGSIGAHRELTDLDLLDMAVVGEEGGRFVYEADLKCLRAGHRGYIVRVIPENPDVRVATELPLAAWQPTLD